MPKSCICWFPTFTSHLVSVLPFGYFITLASIILTSKDWLDWLSVKFCVNSCTLTRVLWVPRAETSSSPRNKVTQVIILFNSAISVNFFLQTLQLHISLFIIINKYLFILTKQCLNLLALIRHGFNI